MSLKFENIANVGDRIRAYHFHERTDCYVEGVVLEKTTHPYEGFECFVITVDVDCWKRWIYPKVDGRKVYVPFEIAWQEWDERVVKIPQA